MIPALATLSRHPPEVQASVLKNLLREQYKQSLYLTTKVLLGYKDVNWATHGDVFQNLESATKRKLIVMPRGTFKSSICSVAYPIWLLLRDPNVRIMLDSELYTNCKNFLREIRQHLQRPELTALFGEFHGETWNEGEITIRQRTVIRKEASITASGIGSERTGQHFEYIICDDLNSPSNSGTIEAREKVVTHSRYNLSILEPTGTLVIVGTRYAAGDVIGHTIATEIEALNEKLRGKR